MTIFEILVFLARGVFWTILAWFGIPFFVFLIMKSAAYGFVMGVEAGRVDIQERINKLAETSPKN
jgi:hypothetical protein